MPIHDHDLNTRQLPLDYFATHATDNNCIICMSTDRRKNIVQLQACNHAFHAQCLTAWDNEQLHHMHDPPSHGTCSTCRHTIVQNPLVATQPGPAQPAPLILSIQARLELGISAASVNTFARINEGIGASLRTLADLRSELRARRLVEADYALSGAQESLRDVRRGLTKMEQSMRR